MKITLHENVIGKIKPMHGVGQPPLYQPQNHFPMFSLLKDAGIPYSRLHDVGGPFGGGLYVDIPNIFRHFEADPTDSANYDFTFTDLLINELIKNGVEPFFRLGVTIENYSVIKPYRIFPPKDYLHWARICEGIIRHYTEGWANGFRHKITYWEIWNEPDAFPQDNQMWLGTKEQFYDFYFTSANYLKEKFPHLKIGGYGAIGFYVLDLDNERNRYICDFFTDFLAYGKTHPFVLDFFSFHSYRGAEETRRYIEFARKALDDAGYRDSELILNEWNPYHAKTRGSATHATQISAMMLMMQDSPLDSAMFYDARYGTCSVYSSVFDPTTRMPMPAYYSLMDYNELYRRNNQLALTIEQANGAYAVAAAEENATAVLMVANPTEETIPFTLHTERPFLGCNLTCDVLTHHPKSELPSVLEPHTTLVVFLGVK